MEQFDFKLLGSDGMSWRVTRREDRRPVLRQNWKDAQFRNNGWVPGRKMRHIARISVTDLEIAENLGYDMSSAEGIYKFLHDYPQYKTVPHIKSPVTGSAVSQGRVIIH